MPDDLIAASAAFAVARIRLRRRDRARAVLGEVVAAAGMGGLAALPWVWLAVYGDEKPDGGWQAVVLPLSILFAGAFLMFVAWALLAAWHLLSLGLRLPRLVGWLVRWGAERAAEAELLRAGEIPAGWAGGSGAWLRGRALAELLRLEPELVRDPATGAIRPIGAIPSRCSSCGAGMAQIGPGLRRCSHCGYGRYDAPPPPSLAWRQTRLTEQGSLYEQVLDAEPWMPEWIRYGGAVAAISAVCAALAGAMKTLGMLGGVWTSLLLISLLTSFGVMAPGWALWAAWCFVLERLPQRQREREELRCEVLRQVEEHGAVSVPDLAARLDLPPARLGPEVLALIAAGSLPVYHDRAADRLISRFCQGADTRCHACAGGVAPGPEGLRCVNCGTVALPLLAAPADPAAPVAPAGPLAPARPAGSAPVVAAPPPPDPGEEPPPAEPELNILLDATTAEAGGEVSGRIRLRLPGSQRCDRVEVELRRRLTRDKPAHDETICTARRVLLEHREVIGAVEEAFVLPVPHDARSWAGKLVQAEWRVYARLLPEGPAWAQVIQVRPGRSDPAAEAALVEAWRAAQRSERLDGAFNWTLVVAVFVLPVGAAWIGMWVVAADSLRRGEPGGLCFAAFAALIAVVAWDMAKGWGQERIAQILMGGSAELPPLLRVGETVEIPVRLRGRLTVARWELCQAQHAGYTVEARTKNGKHTDTRWTSASFWYDRGDLRPEPGEQRIRVTVPEEVTGMVLGGLREFRWSLILRLESGRWKRTVSLPVLVVPLRPAVPAGDPGSPARPAEEQQGPAR